MPPSQASTFKLACSSAVVAEHSSLLYPLTLCVSGPSHPLVACSALCVCLLFTCYTPFRLPERKLSQLLTSPRQHTGLTSYLWLFLIQGKKLGSLAQFVSPIPGYMPTQKAYILLYFPTVTWVLARTHFLPFLVLRNG